MRWTEEQLADHLRNRKSGEAVSAKNKAFALGRLKTGEKNKTEAAYEQTLEILRRAGDVLWYKFEGLKLRLADKTFLTIDFFVMRNDGTLEAHECKGFYTDDAKVKMKVAAEMYPFKFFLVRKKGSGWEYEQVGHD